MSKWPLSSLHLGVSPSACFSLHFSMEQFRATMLQVLPAFFFNISSLCAFLSCVAPSCSLRDPLQDRGLSPQPSSLETPHTVPRASWPEKPAHCLSPKEALLLSMKCLWKLSQNILQFWLDLCFYQGGGCYSGQVLAICSCLRSTVLESFQYAIIIHVLCQIPVFLAVWNFRQ